MRYLLAKHFCHRERSAAIHLASTRKDGLPRRQRNKIWLLAMTVIILPGWGNAQAQGVANFNYQRGSIAIDRAKPPYLPSMPWQKTEVEMQKENARLAVTVDIRPITALYRQAGWMNLSGMSGTEGMLFVLERPDTARLGRLEYFQPLDVLWVDGTGMITSIAPNLMVSELNEPIVDHKPSKALLLLAGGTATKLSIQPGDQIKDSEYFEAPPAMITIPR